MSFSETLGVCLLTAICALVLRETKSPYASLLTLGGGLLLLLSLVPRIEPLVSWGKEVSALLPTEVGETVGKVLAVGLLSGVVSDVCTELGAPTVAAKLELIGQLEILLLALPLLRELFFRAEALLA